ncbi:MAG: GNAT family N-acetyltransferase [Phycisphaerales bacterium]|nr:GNAT family N-acetyltransferase [Phycisphaerales bacterium]
MGDVGLRYETLPLGSDLDAEAKILAIAFGMSPEKAREWIERSGRTLFRRVMAGDRVASVLMLIPMGIYYGGRSVPLTGVAGVAVDPGFRGRGVARWMMHEAVREMGREGAALSGLYSAMHPLYRSVGFEQAGCRFRISVPLHLLPGGSRQFEELPTGAVEQVKNCYQAWASRCDGHLDRGPYVWARIENWRGTPMRGFVTRDDRGEIEAYVYLHQAGSADPCQPQVLEVTDLGARTPGGMRALMAFLGGFSSIAGRVTFFGGPSHPLLGMLDDRRYAMDLTDHWMLRVIDVRRALEGRGYARGLRGAASFELVDQVFEEQSGHWRLELEGGGGHVSRGGHDGARLTDRALAALCGGHLSARQLRLMGLIEGDDAQVDALDVVFPASGSSMPDMF